LIVYLFTLWALCKNNLAKRLKEKKREKELEDTFFFISFTLCALCKNNMAKRLKEKKRERAERYILFYLLYSLSSLPFILWALCKIYG
jgi:hypothetical protein